jgi:ribosomal-protein-alanine N-acetyltransferase|tara:strand:+ start:182 stop:643 length:462 start_codon:yes stop_codon:yes gene_type:complete
MSARKSDLYNFIPMDIKDLDKVYNLELDSYDYPWTKEILRDCILYKYDSFEVLFNNNLVGYVISKITYPETHILNLTVKKSFRKKGIGKSLVELIISDARLRNSENIILEVRVNNIEAQSLYKKLNFQMIGIRKDYYESKNGREDAYVFNLDL